MTTLPLRVLAVEDNNADARLMAEGPGRIGVPELLVGVPFPTAARGSGRIRTRINSASASVKFVMMDSMWADSESFKERTRSVLERASKKLSSTRTLSRRKANSEK
jgi:hypothetical protein